MNQFGEKKCSKCKHTKPTYEFHRNRNRADGRQTFCKVCNSAYNRKWGEEFRATKNYARSLSVDPIREAAAHALNRAVKSGKIKREACVVCGEEKTHGHHHSYKREDWLNVTWLCSKHHKLVHAQWREQCEIHGWDYYDLALPMPRLPNWLHHRDPFWASAGNYEASGKPRRRDGVVSSERSGYRRRVHSDGAVYRKPEVLQTAER